MSRTNSYTLFFAGDPGSAELYNDMQTLGLQVDPQDIRNPDRNALAALNIRLRNKQKTVPWLVDANGNNIGGFEAAQEHLDACYRNNPPPAGPKGTKARAAPSAA